MTLHQTWLASERDENERVWGHVNESETELVSPRLMVDSTRLVSFLASLAGVKFVSLAMRQAKRKFAREISRDSPTIKCNI
jgi:hypothetical protein